MPCLLGLNVNNWAYLWWFVQAHTCFNELILPDYDSYEELHKNLITAIFETGNQFQLRWLVLTKCVKPPPTLFLCNFRAVHRVMVTSELDYLANDNSCITTSDWRTTRGVMIGLYLPEGSVCAFQFCLLSLPPFSSYVYEYVGKNRVSSSSLRTNSPILGFAVRILLLLQIC